MHRCVFADLCYEKNHLAGFGRVVFSFLKKLWDNTKKLSKKQENFWFSL